MFKNIRLALIVVGFSALGAPAVLKVGHLLMNGQHLAAVTWEMRTTDGAQLASIFDGGSVSKLPVEVVKRLVAQAGAGPPECPTKTKNIWDKLKARITPSVLAQNNCDSGACTAHYADIVNPIIRAVRICAFAETGVIGVAVAKPSSTPALPMAALCVAKRTA